MNENEFLIAIVAPAFVPALAFGLLVGVHLLPARARGAGLAVFVAIGVAAYAVSWRDDLQVIHGISLLVTWYAVLSAALLSLARFAGRYRRPVFVALCLLLFPPILFPAGFGFFTMNSGLALAAGLAGQLPRALTSSVGFHLVSFAAVAVVSALVALWLLRDVTTPRLPAPRS